MLLVARWDDDDAGDCVVVAMVDALLATVAPAAHDRSADVRPLIAEAAQMLSRAGHGGTPWQGKRAAQVMASVHSAEEIGLPDEVDIEIDTEGHAADVGRSPASGLEGAGDRIDQHAHITNGVAECHLHPSQREQLLDNGQQSAAAGVAPHVASDTDSQQRTGLNAAQPELRVSKKARWTTAGERNRSRRRRSKTRFAQQLATLPS